jgi:hypothetical protein
MLSPASVKPGATSDLSFLASLWVAIIRRSFPSAQVSGGSRVNALALAPLGTVRP